MPASHLARKTYTSGTIITRKYSPMYKLAAVALILALTLSGCAPTQRRFSHAFIDVLNTVVVVTAYASDQAAFDSWTRELHAELRRLHRLFDSFNEYEGINNIRTINLHAGISAVEVDPEIIELLEISLQAYADTNGTINIALGPVLDIWRDYQERNTAVEGYGIPGEDALLAAGGLAQVEDIEIGGGTVFLRHEGMRLDVGAIAKGLALRMAVDAVTTNSDIESFVLNGGGDIIIGGAPAGRAAWAVGVQSPDTEGQAERILELANTSVFTSGDYHRYFIFEGERFNHIIDARTFMPATTFRSVTVVHPDAMTAEILSTALFIVDINEGRDMIARLGGEAMWFTTDGQAISTPGFTQIQQ